MLYQCFASVSLVFHQYFTSVSTVLCRCLISVSSVKCIRVSVLCLHASKVWDEMKIFKNVPLFIPLVGGKFNSLGNSFRHTYFYYLPCATFTFIYYLYSFRHSYLELLLLFTTWICLLPPLSNFHFHSLPGFVPIFTSVLPMFQQCFTSVYQIFTSVSPVFHHCFKSVSKVLQNVSKIFVSCLFAL